MTVLFGGHLYIFIQFLDSDWETLQNDAQKYRHVKGVKCFLTFFLLPYKKVAPALAPSKAIGNQ